MNGKEPSLVDKTGKPYENDSIVTNPNASNLVGKSSRCESLNNFIFSFPLKTHEMLHSLNYIF